MKKPLLLCLAAVLLLTGCVAAKYTKPPEVTVTYNGSTLTALRGSYNWEYRTRGNSWQAETVDSALPVDSVEAIPTFSRDVSGEVEIGFEEEPDRVSAVAYPVEHEGDFANPAVFEDVSISGGKLTLPSGGTGYIVELHMRWDSVDDAFGEGYYYFQIIPEGQ